MYVRSGVLSTVISALPEESAKEASDCALARTESVVRPKPSNSSRVARCNFGKRNNPSLHAPPSQARIPCRPCKCREVNVITKVVNAFPPAGFAA